jgi:apolipoprotein N-acyltransferase
LSETIEEKPEAKSPVGFQPLNGSKAVLLVVGAAACFHAAYTPANPGPLALLIVGYVVCLVQLARLRTTRQSFYTGLLTGLLCAAPQLECFWRMFGPAAIALWTVLAFWIGLFVAFTHVALVRLGARRAALLLPFLWMGLEYFRSELYYLKFSWLNVGFAFAQTRFLPFQILGVYGIGFCISAYAALFFVVRAKRILFVGLLLASVILLALFSIYFDESPRRLQIAGVQLEFPDGSPLLQALDRVIITNTNVDLIVLSEYTLVGPPPYVLKNWCRDNQKFLIVGGKDYTTNKNFYDTAFVIGTNGDVVFKQVKSVPVQLFKDGLPATEQKLWDSPWGKIGICICYDLSYTRVTDELVRQGAEMLIVPTMDVADWGRHQHELHARIAPVRAAEYGIPIFRLASSGISQGVNRSGRVFASAPFPGQGEMIFFGVNLSHKGSLPLDRYLAPLAVLVTGTFVVWLMVTSRKTRINAPQPSA